MHGVSSVALALLVGVAVPSSAQSLAEAAEAAKKIKHEWPLSTNAGPAPVITNKDLVPSDPATLLPPTTPPSASGAAGVAPPAKTATHGEAYWRARLAPLTAKVLAEEQALVALSVRIDALAARASATVNANRLDDGRATMYGQAAANPDRTEMVRLQTEQHALEATLRADRAASAELVEEGRRAGALPGWLR